MVSSELRQSIKQRLTKQYGSRLHRVILFGSEARGDVTPDSDIDLLVALDGEVDYVAELKTMLACLFDLERQTLRILSPHPASAQDFESGSSALFRSVLREGTDL
jgi:predicted nucleotidyltransferase